MSGLWLLGAMPRHGVAPTSTDGGPQWRRLRLVCSQVSVIPLDYALVASVSDGFAVGRHPHLHSPTGPIVVLPAHRFVGL
jgi:hypothetical protein